MAGENKYLEMVKGCWCYLEFVPEEMQTDEIINAAMEQSACAFMDIKDERKKTYEMCLEAVSGDLRMIHYVPVEFRERVMKEVGNNM